MSNVRRRLFQQARQDEVAHSSLPTHNEVRDGFRRRRGWPYVRRFWQYRCHRKIFGFCMATLFTAMFFLFWEHKECTNIIGDWLSNDSTPFKLRSFDPLSMTNPPPLTIFYNIFIPVDKKGQIHTIRIVEEQMNQVKESTRRIVKNNDAIRLYYYTIGEKFPNRLKEAHFQRDFCSERIVCIHAGHILKGDEDFTLQAIHDFATFQISQNNRNGRHRVSYLHSKGSFHHSRPNERWRYHLTAAALHHECHSLENTDRCDVCGLQFFTEWGLFWPGNMWSARIEHIQRLIPPNEFESKLEEAIGELLYLRWEGILESHLYTDRIDRFGLDRYHSENWIGSHYNLQPCDFSPTDQLASWLKMEKNATALELAVAPRHRGGPADQLERTERENIWKIHNSRREIVFLGGWLIKFQLWYGQDGLPPSDSWFWKWFPDGSFWRNLTGLGPITTHMLHEKLPRHSTDSSKLKLMKEVCGKKRKFWQGTVEESTHAVFLSIDARQGFLDKNLFEAMPWQDQRRDVAIFYQMIGEVVEDMSIQKANERALCSGSSSCAALPVLSRDCAGETLQQVRDFCISHNDFIVSYYEANGQRSEVEVDFARWADDISANKEDVVTTVDYSAAGFVSRGNIWTAKCSYISKLPDILVYAKGLVQASKVKLTLAMKRRVLMELYNFNDYLFTEKKSLDYWLLSHPGVSIHSANGSSVNPSAHWGDSNHAQWKMASGNETTEDPRHRIRECAFLSCHLLTWRTLYHEYPDPESWVWDWFPDGQLWRSGLYTETGTFQGDLIESLTRELAETKV